VDIAVAPGLAGIVRLGALVIEHTSNASADAQLDPPLAAAEAAVRVHPPEESQAVRAMYRRIGLDPTKTRPSSEALLRRVRKGDRLPRINTLVDICNWCSLEFQLPYGLYDVSALQPPVTLRIGTEGESYPGIRKDAVNVADRLTLADQAGPFGNPTSDSARTMVTVDTTSVLTVIFAPAETTPARLATVLDVTAQRLLQFAGGRQTLRAVI
jgi:DNA/RNA-binding domain of Phe-tRNA-synthetase-like protein